MCNDYSESVKPCGFTPCSECAVIKSERDRLQGVVQDMTERAERDAKELHWHNQRLVDVLAENERMRADNAELLTEAARLRDEATRLFRERNEDCARAAVAESKETDVHLALADALAAATDALIPAGIWFFKGPYGSTPELETLQTAIDTLSAYKAARNG